VPVWIAILAAVRASNTGRSVDFGAPVSAADPLNLVGVILPGERVPAISGQDARDWLARHRNGRSRITAHLFDPACSFCSARPPAELVRAGGRDFWICSACVNRPVVEGAIGDDRPVFDRAAPVLRLLDGSLSVSEQERAGPIRRTGPAFRLTGCRTSVLFTHCS
jgi:hypothetical protein